ncbi:MAG: glucosidase [Tepidiformaceae bacterium]
MSMHPHGSAGVPPIRTPGRDAALDAERRRLLEAAEGLNAWKQWGPYLSERQWGTVREDYSPDGHAWEFFPYDHARSRAYRWGEDGLLGISDDRGMLCFALALWNGADPTLKERLFGLSGPQGNHGEDVKEYYYFLESTPTHSSMRALYKYPQRAFPYDQLLSENQKRDRSQPEYELMDTGVFDEDRYFDVEVEYSKAEADDICIRITVTNRGPEEATLQLLPTLWFRNTWSWGYEVERPLLKAVSNPGEGMVLVQATHATVGEYWFACEGAPALLFTDNETNTERLWGKPNASPFVKDGIDEAIVHGNMQAVNPDGVGTKVAAKYELKLGAGASQTVALRLSSQRHEAPFSNDTEVHDERKADADAFYHTVCDAHLTDDQRLVQRQAFAGLLWSKQFYHFDVDVWLTGDPAGPVPPAERLSGRNHEWRHLNNDDIISMPDTWEYPWYAAWDLAFHCIPLALVDPEFAKGQLLLLLREWYTHPNGQLPAYEWEFSDVNPPVQAGAALRVYRIEKQRTGKGDRDFLERVFQKLLLNFTWWVNRKDAKGNNVFAGGFLGLDNIGVFDRSKELPGGGRIEQADGTAWMGVFCLDMLGIALELARDNSVYEDLATKFFEHFMYIGGAMNSLGENSSSLWDEEDGFYFDVLNMPDGRKLQLRVRSLVGLIPLLAVETFDDALLGQLPDFARRTRWFLENRPDLSSLVAHWEVPGEDSKHLMALVRGHRMKALLKRALDPEEFFSDNGLRSVSRYHRDHPFKLDVAGSVYEVDYEPAESTNWLFGGNSNWRGPVWFPLNEMIIEALRKFQVYYGDDFLIECPTGSGTMLTLSAVADEISLRLTKLFLRDADGKRPVFGDDPRFQQDPQWKDYLLFYEYFNGDTGEGLGASHQTGWTALVATLLGEQKE